MSRYPDDAVLCDQELMERLRVSRATFYRMKKDGRLDGFMVVPQITKRTRYSAAIVSRWADGGQRSAS